MKRVIALLGGCMIYAAASLIYQANVLFALVIVAAVLLVRTGREPLSDAWWCAFPCRPPWQQGCSWAT